MVVVDTKLPCCKSNSVKTFIGVFKVISALGFCVSISLNSGTGVVPILLIFCAAVPSKITLPLTEAPKRIGVLELIVISPKYVSAQLYPG